jgi:hypothetical protein
MAFEGGDISAPNFHVRENDGIERFGWRPLDSAIAELSIRNMEKSQRLRFLSLRGRQAESPALQTTEARVSQSERYGPCRQKAGVGQVQMALSGVTARPTLFERGVSYNMPRFFQICLHTSDAQEKESTSRARCMVGLSQFSRSKSSLVCGLECSFSYKGIAT